MNLNVSAKEAKALLDILFNESLRASDQVSRAEPGSSELEEAKQHYELIDSMVAKLCRVTNKP